MSKKTKKGKKKPPSLASLSAEVTQLRAELSALKAVATITQVVSVSVDGPRRSEVAVDAQVIQMTGEFSRSGKRTITLDSPLVSVDLVVRGQVGTQTTFTIEINGRTKKEQFVLKEEHQRISFDFPFSDFGL